MRIAVTGSHGQLAQCLIARAQNNENLVIIALARPDFDLALPSSIAPALAASRADLVINAAAYTAVDKAESEPDLAYAINGAGAIAVAQAAAYLNMPVIQVSTDYVFSGDKPSPYTEEDPTGPVSVYGSSKLAGEIGVRAANPHYLIARTAWVYSEFGANFVKTMLRLAADRDTISVVADQFGNPTSAHDLADGLLVAARQMLDPAFKNWGIVHMAGTGATSWAGLAGHVMEVSRTLGGPWANIVGIPGADYKTAARRPANSRLDTQRAEQMFGIRAPEWQVSVASVVERLVDHFQRSSIH